MQHCLRKKYCFLIRNFILLFLLFEVFFTLQRSLRWRSNFITSSVFQIKPDYSDDITFNGEETCAKQLSCSVDVFTASVLKCGGPFLIFLYYKSTLLMLYNRGYLDWASTYWGKNTSCWWVLLPGRPTLDCLVNRIMEAHIASKASTSITLTLVYVAQTTVRGDDSAPYLSSDSQSSLSFIQLAA